MESDLTIVLITSPIGVHPSTDLVDGVIASFELCDGLPNCPLIIVADGVKVNEKKKVIWKQGIINNEIHQRYLGYCENLRKKYCLNTLTDDDSSIIPSSSHFISDSLSSASLSALNSPYSGPLDQPWPYLDTHSRARMSTFPFLLNPDRSEQKAP